MVGAVAIRQRIELLHPIAAIAIQRMIGTKRNRPFQLLGAVCEDAIGDRSVLREQVGERREVVVAKPLEEGVDVSALTELQVLSGQ